MKKALIILGLIIVVVIVLVVFARPKQAVAPAVLSFNDCAKAGYPIMESHPRQCRTSDGRTYVEELPEKITYINSSADMITVELPFPGAVTGKSFSVIGKARGGWFFEASFPIQLLDANNKVITQGVAQAEGEWMTPEFVPFKADIVVPDSYIGPATLVLKKDNPSDMRQYDASISFPITIEY